ncbi:MAG: nicotinate-nucleotide--dimethylbenzimidazole phosphoribosyltransferase [Acidimicrobiia bacterium]|nr:MAG: nicotinate-nucleotide--dimethylbenzimidazole phosphoribosyltransferase [Acidimicrobiia bacterium]
MTVDIPNLLAEAPEPDADAALAVKNRAENVLRPGGALARLDEVAAWIAGWQRTDRPRVDRPEVLLFAADHGVTLDGVSAYPAEITAAMCHAVEQGQATVTAFAKDLGATVSLFDVGVGNPTGNLRLEPAMDETRFIDAFEVGRTSVADGNADLLILGEMGIGNTTSAAAVAAAICGGEPATWAGPGTGVAGDQLSHKRTVVTEAVDRIAAVSDPMEVLRQVGGAELVAMAGATIEARLRSIPVLLDGYVVTAALLPLHEAAPGSLDHVLAGHLSPEPGHRWLLDRMEKEPLIDLGLRLGEGSGALAALPLVRLAIAGVLNVATFAEAGLA